MPNEHRSMIFLSHSSQDKSAASYIYRLLTEAGFDVWFDETSLVPGMEWESAMLDALSKSRLIFVLLGTERPGQWQAREIRTALEKARIDRKIIPVLLPGADVSFLPQKMWSVQSIDLTSTRDLPRNLRALLTAAGRDSDRHLTEDAEKRIILRALNEVAEALVVEGNLDDALRIHKEQELPGYEDLGDVRSRAVTLGQIADILQLRGQLDEALRIRREEELPVYERLGDIRSRAITMGQIADIFQSRGELDEALRIRREEQLPVFERLGDVREKAVTLGQIADILQARGDLDEALRIRRQEELPVYERIGDVRSTAITFAQIASILRHRGDLDSAAQILTSQVVPVFERLGDSRSLMAVNANLGLTLLAKGEKSAAREGVRLLRSALLTARQLRMPEESARLEGMLDSIDAEP